MVSLRLSTQPLDHPEKIYSTLSLTIDSARSRGAGSNITWKNLDAACFRIQLELLQLALNATMVCVCTFAININNCVRIQEC